MKLLAPLRSRDLGRLDWRASLSRGLLFAILFWIMGEGIRYPWIELVFVGAAVLMSFALLPARTFRMRPSAVLRFVPWFLAESVHGGIDVATRAIRPDLPLAPGFIEYPLRITTPAARAFFSNAVNLLPGTLSIEMRGEVLALHVLDTRQPVTERLERLEGRVADLFVEKE